MQNRKKYLCEVVFHKYHKNPKKYYSGVCVKRNGEYIGFDFNKEEERMKYIINYMEMDGGLEQLPQDYRIIKAKKKLTYLFKVVKNHACYSFNDWADFYFVFSDTEQDEDNGNGAFMGELNEKLGK